MQNEARNKTHDKVVVTVVVAGSVGNSKEIIINEHSDADGC